ncbi:MAG: GPR endopeptidase [Bacilli bacterium]
MHNIDLSKYDIRTDIALDQIETEKEKYVINETSFNDVKVTDIDINKENNIGKKEGKYVTLEFNDITDSDYQLKVQSALESELIKMFKFMKINDKMKCLVIGLGNVKSTPDSLGPLVTDKIIVTKHFFDMNLDVEKNFSNVSIITPGVTGTTGIETSDFINGVIKQTNPEFVIVIDALASTAIERVNRSIQISNAGIVPGSGVGNKRKEISKVTLNVPVIAIGVPTVVDASVIVSDTINYMVKHYAYNKKFLNTNAAKFVTKPVNYLNKNVKEDNKDRESLLGLVGKLSKEDLSTLIYEVLSPVGYNFMVTPKEIDFVIEKLSVIISGALNAVLHKIRQ